MVMMIIIGGDVDYDDEQRSLARAGTEEKEELNRQRIELNEERIRMSESLTKQTDELSHMMSRLKEALKDQTVTKEQV